MKLGELYSVICIIFATNFKGTIKEETLRKLGKNWIIVNQNEENVTGQKLWKNALNEDISAIQSDFENLKNAFEIDFFKLVSDTDLKLFFEKIRYQKPFGELKASHSANMLGCLSAIFKQDTNEQSHIMLGLYLTDYFMPSFRALAKYLQDNAKSDYYKSMGYFLADFCLVVKNSLGLKI